MIDFHLHVPRRKGYLAEILRAYDKAGIEKGVAFGLGEPMQEMSNPELLKATKPHRDRFVPFAFFHLGKDSPRNVNQLADQGFKGLKIIWPTGPYDSERFWPVYKAAEKAGLPILFHTGIVMRTRQDQRQPVSSLWMRPGALDLVARSFPGLRMVAAHLGGPWFDEAFMMARVHPNLWLDSSAGSGWKVKGMDGKYFKAKLGWWNGVSKLVFACDQPHTNLTVQERMLEWKGILGAVGADRKSREAFWSGNAKTILG